VRVAGRLNPSVPHDAEATQDETRVYSGVPHPEEESWRCPFNVRPDVVGSKDSAKP
jgi:hypothetical protein